MTAFENGPQWHPSLTLPQQITTVHHPKGDCTPLLAPTCCRLHDYRAAAPGLYQLVEWNVEASLPAHATLHNLRPSSIVLRISLHSSQSPITTCTCCIFLFILLPWWIFLFILLCLDGKPRFCSTAASRANLRAPMRAWCIAGIEPAPGPLAPAMSNACAG